MKMKGKYTTPLANSDGQWVVGMSLRDYFAAKAMQGIMASGHSAAEDFNPDWEGYDGGTPEEFESVAQEAYLIADAMLKARGEQ